MEWKADTHFWGTREKSYVCKMVKNESFPLWEMNIYDLANVSPGETVHTVSNRLLPAPAPLSGKPKQPARKGWLGSLGSKEKAPYPAGIQVRVQEGSSGSISLIFSKDYQFLAPTYLA